MRKQIAIFGGAFNPPHRGHGEVARALSRLDGIDEVWVMPSANRWDKAMSVSGDDRLEMVRLMIEDDRAAMHKPMRAFDHEARKQGLSSTFETRQELEALYPDCDFHFVCGSDVIPDIASKWVRGQELFDSARFIFIERPGSKPLSECLLPKNHLILPMAGDISLSSTMVRKIAHDGDELSKHVFPSVARFILDKKLYR
ncbi:MAG: nicotinate-nicotinamide nucleotide adenylyltransferase [Candidatus Paceibacterota bacterium]